MNAFAAAAIGAVSIISSLTVPWDIAFESDDVLFVSERRGTIQRYERTDDEWSMTHSYIIPGVDQVSEAGLMGIALATLDDQSYLYEMHAYDNDGQLNAQVDRYRVDGTALSFDTTIIDALPCAQFHCGGTLRFGPDDMLYVSVGDAREPDRAQDADTYHGKLLRMNPDGSEMSIYSLGHRNVQGIAWHPESDQMYASEHGPSGLDGVGGGDEINKIVEGGNYGWPEVSHTDSDPRFQDPAYLFAPDGPPAIAPASAHIVQHESHPWYGDLLIGGLYGGDVYRCQIDDGIAGCEPLGLEVGRVRAIAESPSGDIYISTSNRDGRSTIEGKVSNEDDDQIYTLELSENNTSENPIQNTNYDIQTTNISFLERIKLILLYPIALITEWLR